MQSSKTFIVAVLILFAAGLTWHTSRVYQHFGPGISGDSFRYLSMSQHIASGRGVQIYHSQTGGKSIPMLNFPPLYSLLLACSLTMGIEMQSATTLWNLFCQFLNLLLIGYFVFRITGNALPAFAGMWMVGCDRNLLQFTHYVLTESTFLPLCTLAAMFLHVSLRRASIVWILLTGMMIGIATLTRYIGIGLIPGACLTVLIFPYTSLTERIKRAAILFFTAIVPLTIWLGWNRIFQGVTYDRGLPGTDTTQYFFWELFTDLFGHLVTYPEKNGYLVPGCGIFFIGLIFGLGILLSFRFTQLGDAKNNLFRAITAVSLLCFSYIAVLGFVMGWRHLSGVTDPVRYLLPAYNYLWIFVVLVIWNVIQMSLRRVPKKLKGKYRLLVFTLFFLILMHFFAQADIWVAARSNQGIDGTQFKSWKFISSIHWFPIHS